CISIHYYIIPCCVFLKLHIGYDYKEEVKKGRNTESVYEEKKVMVKKFKYTIAIMITLIIFVWIIEIVNGGLPYVDQWTRPFVIKLNESKLYYFFRGMTEL